MNDEFTLRNGLFLHDGNQLDKLASGEFPEKGILLQKARRMRVELHVRPVRHFQIDRKLLSWVNYKIKKNCCQHNFWRNLDL
ncbi:MAG: hypothetical protein A2W77_01755 [Nitrospinae bacterium RIFCSPLOWO2_12_39_16]|nr:MAG: hypothetical protein A2W77_01755 [Nitrospinae bacterium RIFCSPLOWO2_12_39_16]